MKHKEQIERLVSAGIISRTQADTLERGLRADKVGAPPPSTTLRPLLIAATLTIVFLWSFFFFFAGGGTESPAAIQDVRETLNQPGVIGTMNSALSKLMALTLLLALPFVVLAWLHNSLAGKEEEVHKAWAQVESNYQRRSDLIPNLAEAVSRYMRHEAETLEAVTEKRSGHLTETLAELVSAQNQGADLLRQAGGKAPTEQTYLEALSEAQQRVGTLLHRLVATAENYPALRASDQMLQLQAQLEGTENRINVARMRFNESVGVYNGAMRKFPSNLVASMGNFQRKAYFKADEGAAQASKIEFN